MKISFITPVSDWNLYKNFCLSSLPKGQEYIAVENAKSMSQALNLGMDNAKYKVKCFIHQDCRILSSNFTQRIEQIYSMDKKIGLIGVVGSTTDAGGYNFFWDVGVFNREKEIYTIKSKVDGLFKEVNFVDGLCMITNRDVRFDEETFTDWHFYDYDYCQQVRQLGYKVVVGAVMVQHAPDERKRATINNVIRRERQKFLKKWEVS